MSVSRVYVRRAIYFVHLSLFLFLRRLSVIYNMMIDDCDELNSYGNNKEGVQSPK